MKVALTVLCLIFGTIVFADDVTQFSNPPSNLPIKKIYVHGVQQQPFAGGYANNPNPPVAPQGFQSAQLPEAPAPPAPAPPPPPPPPPADVPPPPPPGPKYPLPECYTNKSGFMCCSKGLEEVINDAYDQLKNSRDGKWSSCNIQQIANKVQDLAQKRFNTTFEAMAGVSDYASKSHFYHNYICKVERDSRYILAYASPRKDRLPGDDFLHGNGQEGDNGQPQPAPYKAHHHHRTFTWRM
uniref:Ground-like domain-containing protein n=1 Tax=Panagrolaimus sp. PS1159 TaxID=55785 RepID=A0AC35FJJ2_9BILA